MSVLIKGMMMPTSCLDCPIYDNYNYHCNLYGYGIPARYNYDSSKRPEWCELEELPEHHGRLIDENEVRIVMNWLLTQSQRPVWNDVYNAIQEMNAVIEAEGADE